MSNKMELEMLPGNKEACRRYYARNAHAAKRRVLLNDIAKHGRISKEVTFEKWGVTIHDVIDAFRKYRENHPGPEGEDKLLRFRILVGNML